MDQPSSPRVRLLGGNDTRIWGLTPAERTSRIAAEAKLQMAEGAARGPEILVNSDYAFDPLWLGFMKERPDSVLTIDGQPAIAYASDAAAAAGPFAKCEVPRALTEVRAEDHRDIYNKALRKIEWPFLVRLTPDAVPGIERRSYYAAYKGVTDILTKYLWPEWALVLTRLAARMGVTPNMVTALGALLCIAATILFWRGQYWWGMGAGLAFMVLDTVDGKLARCTITSSKWGNVFDHGIDLVHPPFWWWAWGVGLGARGLAFTPQTFTVVMAAILGGYLVQRLIEGAFIRMFGMHIHVWQRIDSQFRLITARRNPNMVILFVGTVFGRPDLGLIAVAWWTVISCIFHAVRLLQAVMAQRRPAAITSWLG